METGILILTVYLLIKAYNLNSKKHDILSRVNKSITEEEERLLKRAAKVYGVYAFIYFASPILFLITLLVLMV